MKPAAFLFLALFLPALAFAGPLEDGRKAFDRKNYDKALQLLRPLAGEGDAEAQLYIGHMYGFGNGVEKDPAAAMKWFRKSADQGNARAQFNVGYSYKRGLGVPRSDAKALKWLRKAAEQGDEPAQLMVGGMYAHGEGTKQDWSKAFFWFLLLSKSEADGKTTAAEREAALTETYAKHLTPKQLAAVKKRVDAWKPKPQGKS